MNSKKLKRTRTFSQQNPISNSGCGQMRKGITESWDLHADPAKYEAWCRPYGTCSLLLGLPRTYVRGYCMPSLSGLGLGGLGCFFFSRNIATNLCSCAEFAGGASG